MQSTDPIRIALSSEGFAVMPLSGNVVVRGIEQHDDRFYLFVFNVKDGSFNKKLKLYCKQGP